MKTYIFPYYVSYGKLDGRDGEIEYDLTDEQAERLELSARADYRFHLFEDDELEDIYNEILDSVYEQIIDTMIDDGGSFLDDIIADYGKKHPGESERDLVRYYLNDLEIGINYPEELQDLGDDGEEDEDEEEE